MFFFDEKPVLKKALGKKNVVVQAPEGLKKLALSLAEKLEKQGSNVFVSTDPCFGACDLVDDRADFADLIIHLGHSKLVEPKKPTVFVPVRIKTDLEKTLRLAAEKSEEKKIGLVATVQHTPELPFAKKFLEKLGKEAVIGKAENMEPGQVLGCNYAAAEKIKKEVEAFFFIGTGSFHPLGLAYFCGKKVYAVDPVGNHVEEIDPRLLIKRRYARISKALDAKTWGVLVCLKPGQRKLKEAEKAKKILQDAGKKVFMLLGDDFSPPRLWAFRNIDAYVNTACPRLSIDDSENYEKPVLLPDEVEELLRMKA